MRTLMLGLLLAISSRWCIQLQANDLDQARQAVQRAIPWLEKDMLAWKDANECAACHHGPMYVWSTRVASKQGYPIDHDQFRSLLRWIIEDPSSRVFPNPQPTDPPPQDFNHPADRMAARMMGHNRLSQPTLYLATALNTLEPNDPQRADGWRRIIEHWQTAQLDDGSFVGRKGRPPIFNSPQILTLFSAVALGSTQNPPPLVAEIQQGAHRFLNDSPPDDSQQGIVLRLLLASHDSSSELVRSLIDELLKLQRGDGGWSQSSEQASDAFATGQALYALAVAGVSRDDPHVARALHYLISIQEADGTWPIESRIDPATGERASDLNPITYAATAWCVLGIASHVPATERVTP